MLEKEKERTLSRKLSSEIADYMCAGTWGVALLIHDF
jgi:hypothetical protein